MASEFALFRVPADLEADETGATDGAYFYVYTTSRTKAEKIVQAGLFAEHPHDLCKKGHRHVGLDHVVRGRTTRIHLVKDGIITTSMEDY